MKIADELAEYLKSSPAVHLLIEADVNGHTYHVCTSRRTVEWTGRDFIGINCALESMDTSSNGWLPLVLRGSFPWPFFNALWNGNLKLGHIRIGYAFESPDGSLCAQPETLFEGELCRLVPLSLDGKELYVLVKLNNESVARVRHSSTVDHSAHRTVDMTTVVSPRQERFCETCGVIYDGGPLTTR